jgi:peptidoglycan/LPS O-acetylase OafA/YrhL
MQPGTRERRDILSSPWGAVLVFWIPAVAMVVSGSSGVGTSWRTIVWTVALATMGAACIANALRCGRVHCYLTGPFFLLMALVALLFGLGIVPLGPRGWNILGVVILVGAIALCCLPEMLFGKYRKSRPAENDDR